MPEVAPVLMVGVVQTQVEAELVGGLLGCPSCRGVLGPWGHAPERALRCAGGDQRLLRPRRAKCRCCAGTHVLLPSCCLLRRRDEVVVIGAAIEAGAAGSGHRRIAVGLELAKDTVRGWLRRFAGDAEAIRAHFSRWAFALDPGLGRVTPAVSVFADAVEAIGIAVRTWVLRLGPGPVWPVASLLAGGVLLCHTSCPFPAVA
jgi:hypothetical protein